MGVKEFNIITILKQILLSYSNYKTFFVNVDSVGVLWFIPFLAVIRIIFYFVNKITKSNDILSGIICCLFTIIGIFLSKIKFFLPWSFDVVLAAIIFFYIGYILKKYNLLEKILKNYILILIIFLIWVIGLNFKYIELAVRVYSILAYLVAICGTIVILKISQLIEKYIKYINNILIWYGKNSMYILCFHHFESSIINYRKIGFDGKYEIFIAKLIIVTMFTLFLIKIIKFFAKTINKIKN